MRAMMASSKESIIVKKCNTIRPNIPINETPISKFGKTVNNLEDNLLIINCTKVAYAINTAHRIHITPRKFISPRKNN